MAAQDSVEAFVARQPRVAWRRRVMKGMLKPIGFGLLWDVSVTGEHNIPDAGPTIVMMNHISALDPILVIGAVDNRFVIPMSKIENMHHWASAMIMRWWDVYTIDRAALDRKALINSIELLKSGQLILIAPEGTRHPEGLAEPKEGMTYVATKADAVIVPTAISGATTWKEDLKARRRPKINVNFGRPFRFKTNGRRRIPREEMAQMTREAMYQLALAVTDETKRGVYSDVEKATTETLEFV